MNKNEKLKKLHEETKNYIENKEYENALTCMEEIYEIDPNDFENLENMVTINLIMDRNSKAIEMAERLPEDCWRRYLMFGYYYNMINQTEDALKNYLKAHEMNPNHKSPLLGLAFLHKFEKEYEKAFEYTYKMLEIDPIDIEALALLIDLNLDTFQFEEVIKLSKKALQISDKKDDVIYPALAYSYLMQGEAERGWNCLVKAISKHPDDMSYYATLQSYAFSTNDEKKALDIFNVATIKNPTSPEPHLALAMYYKTSGDMKKARKHYEKYVELEDKYLVRDFDEI